MPQAPVLGAWVLGLIFFSLRDVTDPENGSTTYVYDTLNRLQTLTPPAAFSGTGSFGFSYDALSRRTQMTRPNNVATNYAYDNLSRLQSVLHQLSGSTIDGATYTMDDAGNRTAKTDQRAGVTSNYTYDAIYELTGVTQGTINVDPLKHPCQYECTVKHEMVHARMCAALGGTKFNALSEPQVEVPAYMNELGCYLKLQLDNKLGPYK